MKKVIFLFVLMSLALSAHAQLHATYCEIIGSGNFSGNKIKISFDFGNQGFSYRASDNVIVDEKGTPIEFTSMIDALNYMSKFGWKLQTAYSASIKGMGAQETYRYIMMKEVNNEEDILDGIKLLGKHKEESEVRNSDKSSKKNRKIEDDIY